MAPPWRRGRLAPVYAFLAAAVTTWLAGGVIIGSVALGLDPTAGRAPGLPPETTVVVETALPPTSAIEPLDRLPEQIAPPSACEPDRRVVPPCAASTVPERPAAEEEPP